jgi:ribosomal protein L1
MPNDQVADNILAIYNTITQALPEETRNIKNIKIKLTMGKPAEITEKKSKEEKKKK